MLKWERATVGGGLLAQSSDLPSLDQSACPEVPCKRVLRATSRNYENLKVREFRICVRVSI